MQIERLSPAGVLRLTPRRHGDARGWFSETWSCARLREAGIDVDFIQDNHAYSRDAGTLRGLHLQRPPHAQAKLVRCTAGSIFDVAVDVRAGSPEYGRWVGTRLDARDGAQLLIPRGFLHGYLTLTPDCEVQYKVDGAYAPDCEAAASWSDPEIGIAWPLDEAGVAAPILSEKDAAAPPLSAFATPFRFADPT